MVEAGLVSQRCDRHRPHNTKRYLATITARHIHFPITPASLSHSHSLPLPFSVKEMTPRCWQPCLYNPRGVSGDRQSEEDWVESLSACMYRRRIKNCLFPGWYYYLRAVDYFFLSELRLDIDLWLNCQNESRKTRKTIILLNAMMTIYENSKILLFEIYRRQGEIIFSSVCGWWSCSAQGCTHTCFYLLSITKGRWRVSSYV